MASDARIGDVISHPGVIVTGCGSVIVCGSPTSRIGDVAICAIHGPVVIVTGCGSVITCGSPRSRIGDVCSCGAVIVSGCGSVDVC